MKENLEGALVANLSHLHLGPDPADPADPDGRAKEYLIVGGGDDEEEDEEKEEGARGKFSVTDSGLLFTKVGRRVAEKPGLPFYLAWLYSTV